jgi:hypothetical protein
MDPVVAVVLVIGIPAWIALTWTNASPVDRALFDRIVAMG